MLTLHTYYPAMENPSASPFCVKAMILLNLAGVEWQPHWMHDPRKTVYGKLPVVDGPKGVVKDSNFLIDWLEAEGHDMFPGLDAKNLASAWALIRLTEHSLCEGMAYDRWMDDDCWAVAKPQFFGAMPFLLRLILPGIVRGDVRKKMHLHGIGRFSEEDRMIYMDRDLKTVASFIDGAFLFGDQPTAADAAIAPVLSMIDTLPADTALRRRLRSDQPLMAYLKLARERLIAPLPTPGT